MRKTIVSIVCGMLLVVCGFALQRVMARLRKEPERRDLSAANVRVVHTLPLKAQDEPMMVQGFGTVQARVFAALATEIAGKIVFRDPDLEIGRRLPKGKILIRIDPEPYHIALKKAIAQVDGLLSQQASLEVEIKGYQKSLGVSSEAVRLAQKEWDRFTRLADDDATSKSQVDRTKSTLQTTLGSLIREENSLQLALARRSTLKANLQAAEAAVEEARLNLARTTIVAPFDCCVESRKIEIGEYVNPGKVVAELFDPGTFEVRVPVGLADLMWVLPTLSNSENSNSVSGPVVRVTPSHSGPITGQKAWNGRIARLSGSVSDKTRTVEVIVALPETENPADSSGLPLWHRMFVEVQLPGRIETALFRIPRSLLTRDNGVYLYKNGKLAQVPVEIVRLDQDTAMVRGNLNEGDELISNPMPDAVVGMALRQAEVGTVDPFSATEAK
jgi:RND family efflux transporter MFP subunit